MITAADRWQRIRSQHTAYPLLEIRSPHPGRLPARSFLSLRRRVAFNRVRRNKDQQPTKDEPDCTHIVLSSSLSRTRHPSFPQPRGDAAARFDNPDSAQTARVVQEICSLGRRRRGIDFLFPSSLLSRFQAAKLCYASSYGCQPQMAGPGRGRKRYELSAAPDLFIVRDHPDGHPICLPSDRGIGLVFARPVVGLTDGGCARRTRERPRGSRAGGPPGDCGEIAPVPCASYRQPAARRQPRERAGGPPRC